ncbi:sirohydrochlorin chelatase [Caenimonas soli]|uniref:sirohydrochlorin chelatase n=1 Tax=Caenimonas soli TaxID=2735555 RepID=UPI0015554CFA|nr:CbiX/SirB N-terminal domain-containing protein [Caenimonas soli]NPC54136.1 CbiX/SirB N-terminal domain-containing protein [Caenimonas soli]
MQERKAIILFGHGSRDPLWRRPIEAVASRLAAQQPGLLVRCAYLELDQPDLPAASAQLAAQGATEVTIVPMFLGAGRHAREDLPRLVQALRDANPAVQFKLQQPVGEDPRVLDLLATIALE